ncbi:MAG: MBL fold metallo-hydrolase [Ignavibacteria bacterium]
MFISCQSFIDVGDNMVRHFSKPAKIKNKVKNPVRDEVKLSALWVGHATFLLHIYDRVIFIDPLFTNNVAQVLRRYTEPGIDLNTIDNIDMTLISHSHMDHLSHGSIAEIEKRYPETHLLFPAGAEEFLQDYDLEFHRMNLPENQYEYIGESKIIDSVMITAVTSVHWGGRYGIDGKFWTNDGSCGFIIQYKDVTVYYTSDTSYDDKLFKYIGDKYDIDLLLVNIIYCEDCKELDQGSSHIYPMGAIQIFEDTKAKYMILAHYGLFTDANVQRKSA